MEVFSNTFQKQLKFFRGPLKWALIGDNDMGSDVGDSDPQIREIVKRILHPNYKPPSVYNDIGIFRLNAPVQFSQFILPICLNTETQLAVEQNLIAVGWGRIGPGIIIIIFNHRFSFITM